MCKADYKQDSVSSTANISIVSNPDYMDMPFGSIPSIKS